MSPLLDLEGARKLINLMNIYQQIAKWGTIQICKSGSDLRLQIRWYAYPIFHVTKSQSCCVLDYKLEKKVPSLYYLWEIISIPNIGTFPEQQCNVKNLPIRDWNLELKGNEKIMPCPSLGPKTIWARTKYLVQIILQSTQNYFSVLFDPWLKWLWEQWFDSV